MKWEAHSPTLVWVPTEYLSQPNFSGLKKRIIFSIIRLLFFLFGKEELFLMYPSLLSGYSQYAFSIRGWPENISLIWVHPGTLFCLRLSVV